MRKQKMRGRYPPTSLVRDGCLYKTCTFCGIVKPISAFAKNGYAANGDVRYRDDCKVCYNIRRRENATKKKHSDFIGSTKRRGEATVDYTHQQWKETVIFFGGTCAYCGRTMKRGERLTKDHLVAISDGGVTTQDNVVPACSKCNSSKGAKEWREWFMAQPFFSQERMNHIFKWRSIIRAAGLKDGE